MTPITDASFSGLMAQRPFLRLWFARLAGTSASQMMMVALGWQMYNLTGSAWDLGLIGLYQFAPALLLSLWATWRVRSTFDKYSRVGTARGM